MKRSIFILITSIISITNNIFPQNITDGNYEEASNRILSIHELEEYTTSELRIMRNEIFARHGYIFKTFYMNEYFKKYSWYKPRFNSVNDKLSEIEKENINRIRNVETGTYLTLDYSKDSIIDSDHSTFKKDRKGYSLKNVEYAVRRYSIDKEDYKFLIKKIHTIGTDYRVNGQSSAITMEIYNLDNPSGNNLIYKRIKENVGEMSLLEGNKLIYQTVDAYCCSDLQEFKLVDIEDNKPFILSNKINQIYTLMTWEYGHRWISYYSSTMDETWVYDRNWREIYKKYFDNTKYLKIGTIVYSDEDNIFQMIDIYRPEDSDIRSLYDTWITLGFPDEMKPYERDMEPNNLILDRKSKDFRNFSIQYHIKGKDAINLHVDGNNIIIDQYSNDQPVKILKRDVPNFDID